MEHDYGQYYERLYCEHWWWRSREEFLMKVIQSLSLPDHPSVLDVGCGNGLFFERLATLGATVDGLESDPTLVSPNSKNRDRISIGPFDSSFVPGKRYSLILMLDVLEHLPNPEAALKHATDLLEPQGKLVITVPAFRCLWTTHDDMNHHYTRYTKSELRRISQAADLQWQRWQYFFYWLVPLKMAIRMKEAMIATKPRTPRIPSPRLNQALISLSRTEQWLFSRFPLPIGSSLLAVGGRGDDKPHL
jgi:SAM-dependent methyltransferase